MCSFSDTNIDPNGLRNRWFEICSRSLIVRLWIVLERTPVSSIVVYKYVSHILSAMTLNNIIEGKRLGRKVCQRMTSLKCGFQGSETTTQRSWLELL